MQFKDPTSCPYSKLINLKKKITEKKGTAMVVSIRIHTESLKKLTSSITGPFERSKAASFSFSNYQKLSIKRFRLNKLHKIENIQNKSLLHLNEDHEEAEQSNPMEDQNYPAKNTSPKIE